MFPLKIRVFLVLLPLSCISPAATKPSAELQRAVAAAAHARTQAGEPYAQSVSRALLGLALEGTNCMGHMPGWSGFPGFQAVLVIDRAGTLKWIIRDAHDPMANCVLKKLLKATLPAPPADNWPVLFGITMKH